MEKSAAVFGITAACAACCTLPFAVPLLSSAAVSGMAMLAGWPTGFVLILVALAAVVALVRGAILRVGTQRGNPTNAAVASLVTANRLLKQSLAFVRSSDARSRVRRN